MQLVQSEEVLAAAIREHQDEDIVIFKHSTTCPISAAAYHQVEQFEAQNETPVYLIRVIEERPLSLGFADMVNVKHASPQVIVMKNGVAKWHTSHYEITAKTLVDQTNNTPD